MVNASSSTTSNPTSSSVNVGSSSVRPGPSLISGIIWGLIAGLVGGVAFGAAMIELGLLESVALLVRAESASVGFIVHLIVAAIIGAGFGALVAYNRPEPGETVIWGFTYGAMWWFIGAVTLLPALSGSPVSWTVDVAQGLLPALLGHLIYGGVVGFVIAFRRYDIDPSQSSDDEIVSSSGSVIRGGFVGVVGAILLGLSLDMSVGLPLTSMSMVDTSAASAWLVTLSIGLVTGVVFARLFPGTRWGGGPALIRGAAFGVVWWLLFGLTLLPLAQGGSLQWGLEDVREGFVTLPAYVLLLGAVPAILSYTLAKLGYALLSDNLAGSGAEGVGTHSLRAVARGAISGVLGGLVFTLVMARIGFLSTVSELVGLESDFAGLIIHLIISIFIGVSYGVLFVRRSNDVNSALGWGAAYGAVWWLAGPLTLLPIFLGEGPTWTLEAARDAYPALVGHLAYGAVLGVVLQRLELRHNPWWVPRNRVESVRADRTTAQLRSSAPSLWLLLVLVTVTLPVLLS